MGLNARKALMCWLLACIGLVVSGMARAVTLVGMAGDASGVGRVLTTLDSATAAVIGSPALLGDGSQAYNGGLAYDLAAERFFAIANDSVGQSRLMGFSAADPALLTVDVPLGTGFIGGLAFSAAASRLYALQQAPNGEALLVAMGLDGSGLTPLGALGFGLPSGLTWHSGDGQLYAVGADVLGVARTLFRIDPLGVQPPAALFELGDGSLAFNGGLAVDALSNRFYAVASDASAASSLYSFDVGGPASLLALGPGPFGRGFNHAGLVLTAVPEPPIAVLMGLGLLGLGAVRALRRQPGNTTV